MHITFFESIDSKASITHLCSSYSSLASSGISKESSLASISQISKTHFSKSIFAAVLDAVRA